MQYRADIDGMRAVAIATVVAYHAAPQLMPGGFVGVDVFFVLSGYLISGILLHSGYRGFYRRRAIRIFPALLAALALTTGLGVVTLLPNELRNLGRHLQASTGFVENLLLQLEVGYFDPVADSKPLLHLWSLAVEEQFYIFWPLLLLGLRRWVNPWLTSLGFLAASLAVCWHAGPDGAALTFFNTAARAWELLAGAVAWLASTRWPAVGNGRARDTGSAIGAVAILGSALFLHRGSWHPGPLTLLPVLGTVMLLLAGPEALVNRVALSQRVPVYLGKISYPLYLFHWPLLAYAYLVFAGAPSPTIRFLAVALALLAAAGTYQFVERPIQRRRSSNGVIIGLCMGVIGVFATGTWLHDGDGMPQRGVVVQNHHLATMHSNDGVEFTGDACGATAEERTHLAYCVADVRDPPTRAVWGDSKAKAIYWGLVRQSAPGQRWSLVGMQSCAPLTDVQRVHPYAAQPPEVCAAANRAALDVLRRNAAITTVVVAAGSRLLDGVDYVSRDGVSHGLSAVQAGLTQSVRALQTAGKTVLLLADNPTITDPQNCIVRVPGSPLQPLVADFVRTACTIKLSDFRAANRAYRTLLEGVATETGASVLDPTPVICDAARDRCDVVRDGKFLYGWTDHYCDYGNGLVGRRVLDAIGP